MCKLAMLPYFHPSQSALVWQLARHLTAPMVKHDRDGFGYAAVSPEGLISVERWLTGSQAWQAPRAVMPPDLAALAVADSPAAATHDSAGATLRDAPVAALLLHSRMATTAKGLQNNHPHVSYSGDAIRTALIHNGVVQVNAKRLRFSTCDSETILTGYDKHNVGTVPGNWQNAADEVQGYYALGIAHRGSAGTVVDIVRDSAAALSLCYVPELNAPVYATDPDHVRAACKAMGWRAPVVAQVKPLTVTRFNPLTRTIITHGTFTAQPRAAVFNWQDWSEEQAPRHRGQYLSAEQGEVQEALSMLSKRELRKWRSR